MGRNNVSDVILDNVEIDENDNDDGDLMQINTEINNGLIVEKVCKYLANATVESSPGNTSRQS